jgi:indoleamine 2,3-dioxygenase
MGPVETLNTHINIIMPGKSLIEEAVKSSDFLTIPQPCDYGIDFKNGFLPIDPPLILRLCAYYEPWELLVDNLPLYLQDGTLRKRIENLPLLSLDKLETPRDWQRAYTVLSFLGNGYVWADNNCPAQALPIHLSDPWIQTSSRVGLNPVVTYAGVELFNFRVKDQCKKLTLENLEMYQTFTGTRDEAWFLLISLGIEAKGGDILKCIVDGMNAVVSDDVAGLSGILKKLRISISELYDVLVRMGEQVHVFYFKCLISAPCFNNLPKFRMNLAHQ